MGTDYTKLAEDFIIELERKSFDNKESLEQFYRGLRDVIDALRERLDVAEAELPKDIAQELTSWRR